MNADYCTSLGGTFKDDEANSNRKVCYIDSSGTGAYHFAGLQTDLDALKPVNGKLDYDDLEAQCKKFNVTLTKKDTSGDYLCPSHFDLVNKLVVDTPEMKEEEQKKKYLIYGGGGAAALCVSCVCCLMLIMVMRR